ncbi:hypothetical protein GCM10028802_04530 [Terrabacter terrigena]
MADPFRAWTYLLTVRLTCRDVKARTVEVRRTSERVAERGQGAGAAYEVGRGLSCADVGKLMASAEADGLSALHVVGQAVG